MPAEAFSKPQDAALSAKAKDKNDIVETRIYIEDSLFFFNTLDWKNLRIILTSMKKRAVYPGTFDPVTNGHVDIISRAANIFPEIIVAVASNETKKPFLPLQVRIELLEEALGNLPGVTVVGFNNLLIEFVTAQKADIILRGLRAVNDFEYEFQLAGMNRKLAPHIETVFLTPSEHLMFISSTLVREIARLNGNISQFVPPGVVKVLQARPEAPE